MKVLTIITCTVVLMAVFLAQPSVGSRLALKKIAIAGFLAKVLKPRFVPLPIPLPFPLKFSKDVHGKPYPVHSHSHSSASHFVPSFHGHEQGLEHGHGHGHGGFALEGIHGLDHVGLQGGFHGGLHGGGW